MRNVEHPVVALLNDGLGLALLVGVALAAWRRFVRPDAQLRHTANDGLVLALLALIGLTGYPVEAFRLLAEGASAASWSFVGAPLARLLAPLDADWQAWHSTAFWGHFALTNVLLFYAPFSRFSHAVFSPLIAALNGMETL